MTNQRHSVSVRQLRDMHAMQHAIEYIESLVAPGINTNSGRRTQYRPVSELDQKALSFGFLLPVVRFDDCLMQQAVCTMGPSPHNLNRLLSATCRLCFIGAPPCVRTRLAGGRLFSGAPPRPAADNHMEVEHDASLDRLSSPYSSGTQR